MCVCVCARTEKRGGNACCASGFTVATHARTLTGATRVCVALFPAGSLSLSLCACARAHARWVVPPWMEVYAGPVRSSFDVTSSWIADQPRSLWVSVSSRRASSPMAMKGRTCLLDAAGRTDGPNP